MFTSAKYSNIILKLGMATVFLWFGVDKFLHPAYWINIYTEIHSVSIIKIASMSASQWVYLVGVFEILVGLSLITGVFTKFFSVLGIIFLLIVMFLVGANESTVRNIGLISGFAALILWPDNRSRF